MLAQSLLPTHAATLDFDFDFDYDNDNDNDNGLFDTNAASGEALLATSP